MRSIREDEELGGEKMEEADGKEGKGGAGTELLYSLLLSQHHSGW